MARILCVDDVRDNLLLLQAELEDEGFEVELALDGQTALDRIADDPPDAVILDIMMPGLNGLEVLERIRQDATPLQLPVIMATALDRTADVVGSFERGANDYVVKPIEIEVLLARLRTHLEMRVLAGETERLLASREEFMVVADHDLRNGLGVVVGLAGLLSMQLDGDPARAAEQRCASRIEDAGLRMGGLIADLLNLDGVDEGLLDVDLVDLDLSEVVAPIVAEHEGRASMKGIDLSAELPEGPLRVRGHRGRIGQVVDNLVGNALKFCRRGDRVVVVLAGGSEACCEVVDSGPGLTPDDLLKAFQRDVTLTSEPTDGESSSGLGLPLCRALVEAHGGRIGVRNNEVRGATFWFSLPIV